MSYFSNVEEVSLAGTGCGSDCKCGPCKSGLSGSHEWRGRPWPLSLGEPATKKFVRDQIRFIDAVVTGATRNKRVEISYQRKGPMRDDKRVQIFNRFFAPMLKHTLGIKLMMEVNQGNHTVEIAWHNGKFGFTGTIALDRAASLDGRGSASVIFIDEEVADWKRLPTIVNNPDIGLFHELLHALRIQQGTNVDNEAEIERQVIGIGKYSNAKRTENAYRDAKGLQLRCCWNRETL